MGGLQCIVQSVLHVYRPQRGVGRLVDTASDGQARNKRREGRGRAVGVDGLECGGERHPFRQCLEHRADGNNGVVPARLLGRVADGVADADAARGRPGRQRARVRPDAIEKPLRRFPAVVRGAGPPWPQRHRGQRVPGQPPHPQLHRPDRPGVAAGP